MGVQFQAGLRPAGNVQGVGNPVHHHFGAVDFQTNLRIMPGRHLRRADDNRLAVVPLQQIDGFRGILNRHPLAVDMRPDFRKGDVDRLEIARRVGQADPQNALAGGGFRIILIGSAFFTASRSQRQQK